MFPPSYTVPASANNRNILECKSLQERALASFLDKIIETYWNVNSCLLVKSSVLHFKIIETYWNVNLIETHHSLEENTK